MQRATSSVQIELVYDSTCPNVDRARSMIRMALGELGEPLEWIEWDRDSASTPAELRHYGSPTVLVNGHDVGCDENAPAVADANSCRIYMDDCGCLCGAPSSTLIVQALRGVKAA
jgi:mercuric ion transport protein